MARAQSNSSFVAATVFAPLWAALCAALLAAGACTAPAARTTGGSGSTGTPDAPPRATHAVTDDEGRALVLPVRPERVVSLAPNITETIFAIGAGDRVVGDTLYCDYPEEAKAKEHVGDTLRPDLERIVALKPDLVLISTSSQLEDTVGRLEQVGIPTFVLASRDFADVLASVERLGDLLDAGEPARALAASLRARADEVARRVSARPAPKVFVMVGDRPLITAGRGTFVDDLVRRAGGVSISGDEASDWPQYSPEAVIARAPETIVLPTDSHGVAGETTDPEALALLRETPAVRAGHIVRIDGNLIMRPGPRLVDGLERLARALHSDAFADASAGATNANAGTSGVPAGAPR